MYANIYIYIYNIYIYIGSIAYQATIGILDLFVFDLHSPFNLQLGAAAMFVFICCLTSASLHLISRPLHLFTRGRWGDGYYLVDQQLFEKQRSRELAHLHTQHESVA